MPSVIAEAHYDSGRNFIAMVKGRKRYIIAHPNQCKYVLSLNFKFRASIGRYDNEDVWIGLVASVERRRCEPVRAISESPE